MHLETIAFLGFVSGIVHHVIFQFPQQKSLIVTLSGFWVMELTFLAILFNEHAFSFLSFSLFTTIYTIYNVYFRHRGIPGKFWFRASDWTFYRLHKGKAPHRKVAKMHDEIGDIMRLQPNHISFRTMDALDDIYGHNSKCNKGEMYVRLLTPPGVPPSVATETNFERHNYLRRLIMSSMSPTSLKNLEPTMMTYFAQFIAGIKEQAKESGGVVRMNKWFHNLAFDVAGALTMGTDFNALHEKEEHFFVKAIHAGFRFMNIFYGVPWLAQILQLLPAALKKRAMATRARCAEFTAESIKTALERESIGSEKTILGILRGSKDPETGEKLGFKELVTNANTLLVAGADTTAISMTFALYYALATPRVWERLCKEVREKFKSEDEISGQTTQAIPYLTAIINEALRLVPAAAAGLHRVTPPEGCVIAGKYIAGNTIVSVPTWGLLHDPRYFSNPEEFIPERWIDSSSGETCANKAWIPFAYGQWSCIGKPLALMEIRIALSKLVWNFDLEVPSDQGEPEYDHIQIAAGKLCVVVKPRELEQ